MVSILHIGLELIGVGLRPGDPERAGNQTDPTSVASVVFSSVYSVHHRRGSE